METGQSQSQVTSYFGNLLELLQGRGALNLTSFLIIVPLVTLFESFTFSELDGATASQKIFAIGVSQLALAVALYIIRPILLPLRWRHSAWRIICFYMLGSLASNIVLVRMLNLDFHFIGDAYSAWTILTFGILVLATWVFIGHFTVASVVANYSAVRDLVKNTQLVADVIRNYRTQEEAELNELRKTVSERIDKTLSNIQKKMKSLTAKNASASLQDVASMVKQINESEVRALSHEIQFREVELPESIKFRGAFRLTWRLLLGTSFPVTSELAWVFGFGLMQLLSYTLTIGGWEEASAALATVVVGLCIVLPLDALRRRYYPRHSQVLRLALPLIIYVGSVLAVFILVLWIGYYLPILHTVAIHLTTPILVSLIAMWTLLFLFRGFASVLDERKQALLAAKNELSAQLNAMQRRSNELRSKYAQLLHGTLQGKLSSVALYLASGASKATREQSKIIKEATAQFEKAAVELRSALDSDPTPINLQSFLAELKEDWGGFTNLSIRMPWQIDQVLDPALEIALIDAIRECVINATRHGKATEIEIDVTLQNETLQLLVTNNGNPPSDTEQAGLGWGLIESTGGRISLSALPAGGQVAISWIL